MPVILFRGVLIHGFVSTNKKGKKKGWETRLCYAATETELSQETFSDFWSHLKRLNC